MPGWRPRRALRTARLLSLPAAPARSRSTGAVRRLVGQDREAVAKDLRARNAARTRRVLGELKGGALKAGQLLATVEALFPQDPEATWREALHGLQGTTAALPFAEVEPVLVAELGPDWRRRLPDARRTAAAAASLGQVHRAAGGPTAARSRSRCSTPASRRRSAPTSRRCPGVPRGGALVAPGLALPPLVAELRDRLTEELDYEHEAARPGAVRRRRTTATRTSACRTCVAAPPGGAGRTWLDGTPLAEVALTASPGRARPGRPRWYQRFLRQRARSGSACCTPTRTRATSGCSPTAGSASLDFGSTPAAGRDAADVRPADRRAAGRRPRGGAARGCARTGSSGRVRELDVRKLRRLPGAVQRAGAARGVPLQPGVAARRSSAGSTTRATRTSPSRCS